MNLRDYLPAMPPFPPVPSGLIPRGEEEEETLDDEDKLFIGLPPEAKRQAMNYIRNWRGQDIEEAVEKWKKGLSIFGAPPGPLTTEAYREETSRKVNNKERR